MPIKRKNLRQKWQPLIRRLLLGYVVVCSLLYFQQQRLMFFPSRQLNHTPTTYGLDYRDVWLPISDKPVEMIHGWWIEAKQPNAPVILYLHHNAVNIGANITQALQFHQLGYSVFLFDYRGFGKSKGAFPRESQVYEDAQIAWDYLTQERQIKSNQIIIYGHSIGGAIAIDLASNNPETAALIVHNSFTSMKDMTKRFGLYWFLPIEFILRQRFKSIEKMKTIEMPVLIITGTSDIQIPLEMGQRLYETAPESKQLIVVEGGGHDNHLSEEDKKLLKGFIDRYLVRATTLNNF